MQTWANIVGQKALIDCNNCKKTTFTSKCSNCLLRFCYECHEYDLCYSCAKQLGKTPICGSMIKGHLCGLNLDPNTDVHNFEKLSKDPNCPDYVFEYVYGNVPPQRRWYGFTKEMKLPLIAHQCGYCHVDLCHIHVIETKFSHYVSSYTCQSCVPKIRKNLKLNDQNLWV